MANQRIFQAQALVTNTVAVGGMASLGFNAAFRDIIRSGMDGAFGIEDVDKAGLRVGASMSCTDVIKVLSILSSTPGDTTFSGKESGAATWHNYVVASILWHAMNLTIAKAAEGTLRLDGAVRFADGTKTLADVIAVTAGVASAPSKTSPAALYRPHTASFTPDGGAAIMPLHTQSVTLALAGNLEEDYGDTDIGHTAVDLGPWNDLQITLVHRDALAVSPGDIAAALLAAAKGVLTVPLLGRGGGADKVLTVNNMQWTGVDVTHGPSYTDFAMTGVAGWKKRGTPDVNYDLTGANKLFEIA